MSARPGVRLEQAADMCQWMDARLFVRVDDVVAMWVQGEDGLEVEVGVSGLAPRKGGRATQRAAFQRRRQRQRGAARRAVRALVARGRP